MNERTLEILARYCLKRYLSQRGARREEVKFPPGRGRLTSKTRGVIFRKVTEGSK